VPRGRKADDRLAALERRLDALLEARDASLPEPLEYTDEEIVEIGLILLAYVCEDDTEKVAGYLAKDSGTSFEETQEIAVMCGRILEERRAVALNPRCPL
jgi:hypothetical protein